MSLSSLPHTMPSQTLDELKQELVRRGAHQALATLDSMSRALSPFKGARQPSPFGTRLMDGKPLSPVDIVRSVESGDPLSPQLLKVLSERLTGTLSPLHAATLPSHPSPPPQVAIRYPESLAEEIEAQKVELRRACAEMILAGDLERARGLLSTVDSWGTFNAQWAESERSARVASLEHALEVQRGEVEALQGALQRLQPVAEKSQPRFELGASGAPPTASSPATAQPPTTSRTVTFPSIPSSNSGRSSQVTAAVSAAAAAAAGAGVVPPSSVTVSVNSPFPPPLYLQDPLPPPPSTAFVSALPSFEAPPKSLETSSSRRSRDLSGISAPSHKRSFWNPPPDATTSDNSSSRGGLVAALDPIPPFRGGSARNAVEPAVEEEEDVPPPPPPPPPPKKPGYFEQLFDELFNGWSCYPSSHSDRAGKRQSATI